jgi:hypothetical protein
LEANKGFKLKNIKISKQIKGIKNKYLKNIFNETLKNFQQNLSKCKYFQTIGPWQNPAIYVYIYIYIYI